MPLHMRILKAASTRIIAKDYAEVNLARSRRRSKGKLLTVATINAA